MEKESLPGRRGIREPLLYSLTRSNDPEQSRSVALLGCWPRMLATPREIKMSVLFSYLILSQLVYIQSVFLISDSCAASDINELRNKE